MRVPLRRCILALLLATLAEAGRAGSSAQPAPTYRNATQPAHVRALDLISRMTPEEKIAQMQNDAPAIPRLGVPSYNWWSEGLHGVARSGEATTFPQAIGLAATWDSALMHSVGEVIAEEARAKYEEAQREGNHTIFYGLTLWSPNINILRDPRWGRGQETYGEDPFLTAHLAVPFIRGLQGDDPTHPHTIATPKHFAVHSGPESDRHREDVHPTPYDLWDTYLPAFRASIVEGRAQSIMCAYNSVNGHPACGSKLLLTDILRRDWGFQGFVTSDCGAIDDFFKPGAHGTAPDAEHAATEALLAGTDTNCGSTYSALRPALARALITTEDLDRALLRLFEARFRLGMFDLQSPATSRIDRPAHERLALEAARKSIVLLKNNGVLPLDPRRKQTLAVIGPNAVSLSSLEGNYNSIPRAPVQPLDGIQAAFPESRVLYAQGAPFVDGVALPVPRSLYRQSKEGRGAGLFGEYFNGQNITGKPQATRFDPQLDFDWTASAPLAGINPTNFSVRWTGAISVPAPGTYTFSVGYPECYPCDDRERFDLYLDGKLAGQSQPLVPTVERKTETPTFQLTFSDTAPHPLRIEYHHESPHFGAGFRLDWAPPAAALRAEALSAAAQADVIVAVLGLSPLLEGEEMPVQVPGFAGGDKTDLKLPQAQQTLLEALAATGKPIVVVLLNGSALTVEWAQQHAAAILEAWYPGQAGGTAIGETLSGANNPAGRLPMTFPRSIADLPPFSDYSMAHRTYRYNTTAPSYGFGFGLSYTTFGYSRPQLNTASLSAGDTLSVTATVTNTGQREGDEVAELYLCVPHTSLTPGLALAGFSRLHLKPGESRQVIFHLDPRTLSTVDGTGSRAVEPGQYRLYVGGQQPPSRTDAWTSFTVSGRAPVPR